MTTLVLALLAPVAHADWSQLHAPRAEATSFLKSNWNKYNENYHPNYVLDGDPKTAWVEGVDGQGTGQQLRIPLSRLDSVDRVKLRIRNGYQKSDNLLAANSAPNRLTLSIEDRGETVASDGLSLGREMGWQEVELAVPAGKGLDALVLEVVSVHPGSTYKDTCISDIEVFVQSSVAYNASAEQAKAARLSAWIKERLDEAAWFESRPADYPFVSEHFTSERTEVSLATYTEAAAASRAELEVLKATSTWHRADGVTELVLPDGMPYGLDLVLPLLQPGGPSWFEATDAKRSTEENEWRKRTMNNYKLRFEQEGDRHPRTAWLQVTDVLQERAVYTDVQDLVATLDDQGRLVTLWVTSKTDSEPWHHERVLTLERAADGKVSAVTELELSHQIAIEPEHARRIRYTAQ